MGDLFFLCPVRRLMGDTKAPCLLGRVLSCHGMIKNLMGS